MKPLINLIPTVLIIGLSCMLVACLGGGGSGSATPSTPALKPTLALFAGNMGGAGNIDGSVASAYFNQPTGVATDNEGNFYVADSQNNTIRKITSDGVVSTLAGTPGNSGSSDGIGAAARFNSPYGIATDASGNIYVSDTVNSTIRKITPTGVVSTLAGTPGVFGSADGVGAAASFNVPAGVATDRSGNVYVADSYNNNIRKITPTGEVSTLAGMLAAGSTDGTGVVASFAVPTGVTTDSAGNVYVADSGNCIIRKITPSGVVSTLAGSPGIFGNSDGVGVSASFSSPTAVATDSASNIYVVDRGNNAIRKITPAGVVSTLPLTPGVINSADGNGAVATLYNPSGVATDGAGNVYVADTFNNAIRKITPTGVLSTLAGKLGVTGSTDGIGVAASFNVPNGVSTNSAGTIYVADTGNYTIRKITQAGAVTTLAGTAGVNNSNDGTGVAASFTRPTGVATDSKGNVYVADAGSNDGWVIIWSSAIRKITPSGEVSTLAGRGAGTAASFSYQLGGIATDTTGNIYVADTGNYAIRKITQAGVVTTLAGTTGISGSADGVGTVASFNAPAGIATDSAGNVYVADSGNNTIRKIAPSGVVSTLAGTAGVSGSTDGTGAAASFKNPTNVATDSEGNIYVADFGNNTIRKITPFGEVKTVAGVAGRSGFLLGSLPGVLSGPSSIAISGTTLYTTMYNGVAVVNNVP